MNLVAGGKAEILVLRHQLLVLSRKNLKAGFGCETSIVDFESSGCSQSKSEYERIDGGFCRPFSARAACASWTTLR
jgi:hypothetical protein